MNCVRGAFLAGLVCFGTACKTEAPTGPSPEDDLVRHPIELSRLHGTWRTLDTTTSIKFIIYDSTTTYLSEKRDYGYNCRSEATIFRSTISGNIAYWGGDPWMWLEFSDVGDTLIVAYDSLWISKRRYQRDTTVGDLMNWIEVIPIVVQKTLAIDPWHVEGVGSTDSTIFMLTINSDQIGQLWKIGFYTGVIDTFDFPEARAIDVAGGYLWLLSHDRLEKRNLQDTLLVEQYSSSDFLGAQGLLVESGRIIIKTWHEILTYSPDMTLLDRVQSYSGLSDMMSRSGSSVWATSGAHFHRIDLNTGIATGTYDLAPHYGRVEGLTKLGDKQICLVTHEHNIGLHEVVLP